MVDSDGDGLLDCVETHGIMDNFGHVYCTDPENPDTDGDGLIDGLEVGVLQTNAGSYIEYSFNVISDPTEEYSDDDSLNDLEEYELGINPLSSDTDHDGLDDDEDPEPLKHTKASSGPSTLEIGRAIVLGAVFGETGIEDGSLSYLVDYEIASSPYYLVGWIGFSLVPVVGAVADARDAVQALINGDELGAAMNAAGAFSGVGDGVKTAAAVGLFVTKYSSKISDIQKVLIKVLDDIPPYTALKVLDSTCDEAASALNAKGVTYETVKKLVDKGIDLKRARTLLDTVYTGAWSPGRVGDAAKNFENHYNKHVVNQFEWGRILTESEYRQKATDLINRPAGVEIYYQRGIENMAVYNRATGEFATGNELGEIQTFFIPGLFEKPDGSKVNYVDNLINEGKLINLN